MFSKYYNIVNSTTTTTIPMNIRTHFFIPVSIQCYYQSIKNVQGWTQNPGIVFGGVDPL